MQQLKCSPESLSQLQGLSELHTLCLAADHDTAGEGLQAVCQLTRLRELQVFWYEAAEAGLLLQLTQLSRLTSLHFGTPKYFFMRFTCDVSQSLMGCMFWVWIKCLHCLRGCLCKFVAPGR